MCNYFIGGSTHPTMGIPHNYVVAQQSGVAGHFAVTGLCAHAWAGVYQISEHWDSKLIPASPRLLQEWFD